ncbi:FadR/GntR family transcriptional regulator [Chelativorans xinjiangense]|uniref:FadR/GntR family transcriptional regulator n=1 Tax=Chelativorans xinjiangense TaxID=2681485 RepID=UPI00135C46B9|nr:FCD domain-containing protein [Chelativorans xinjiangense]
MSNELNNGSNGRTNRSVPARVAEAIQRVIAEDGLKPGDQIPSQRVLATTLGASRSSVREGISMLETLGIVRVEVGRGIFIAVPDKSTPGENWRFPHSYSLREVYQFRKAVEPAALALAAPHFRQTDLAAMRAYALALGTAGNAGNAVSAAEQDSLFHDLIYARCGNRIFQALQAQMRGAIQGSQWAPMVIIEKVKDTAREHLLIVDALEKRDVRTACAALEDHIDAAAKRCNITLAPE